MFIIFCHGGRRDIVCVIVVWFRFVLFFFWFLIFFFTPFFFSLSSPYVFFSSFILSSKMMKDATRESSGLPCITRSCDLLIWKEISPSSSFSYVSIFYEGDERFPYLISFFIKKKNILNLEPVLQISWFSLHSPFL